jgi:hypothetical protein
MAPGHDLAAHDTTKGNDQRNPTEGTNEETITAQSAGEDEVSGNYVPPVR